MNASKNITMKPLPQFSSKRCKRCGICTHFCAMKALATQDDGMPYLADPQACTSCGLCQDMCPDWAVSLEPTEVEATEEKPKQAKEEAKIVKLADRTEPAEPSAREAVSAAGE